MIARSGRFSIIPARAIDDPRLGKAALLVLCALWGFVSHVRHVDGVLSVRTFIGGVSLGLTPRC